MRYNMMKDFFIQYHPGTLSFTANLSEEAINQIIKDGYLVSDNDSDEYKLFYHLYVVCGVPLSDIPNESDLSERTCSAWAADMVPSFAEYWNTHYNSNNKHEDIDDQTSSSSSEGFDIYEWAKTHNADYYDHNTGYIYLVQNYNRALNLGLPTPGIGVLDNGNLIGYARKMN